MKVMKNTFKSLLSFVLALLMMFYVLPADIYNVFAAEDTNNVANSDDEKAADALFELTDLRTADTKYIQMSDGTIQALVYDQLVHWLDDDGNWQEVDNRLSSTGDSYESADLRVKFSKKITGNNQLFTLHDGNRKISLSLNGATKKTPIKIEHNGTSDEKFATRLEKLSTLSNAISSVRYNEILQNTDIEYILDGTSLKENILVNAPGDSYTYIFTLSLNNLTATVEDGAVVLSDGDTAVFVLPAPFMYDAAGVRSDAVSYSLAPDGGNGKYILTLSADNTWINEEERAFPITIDPTITLTNNNATNASVSSDGGVFSYYMDAGVADGVSYRSYISFTIPTLPDGSIVTEAILKLYQDGYHKGSANTSYIAARQVTSSWSASSLRWSNKPQNQDDVLDYATVSSSTTGSRLSFDITSAYRKWNSGKANYGIMLSAVQDTACGGYVQLGGTGFSSGKRPILEVKFRNTRGLEDRFTYQTMSIGAAGELYICDNSLERTIIKPLAYTYAGSVNLVYNSIGSGSSPVPSNMLSIANGWSLSVNQTITHGTYSDYGYAEWVDEDGTSHYYCYRSGNGFIDEDNDENIIYFVGLNVLSLDLSDFSAYNSAYASLEEDYGTYLMVKSTGEKVLYYNGVMVAAVDTDGNITEYHYNETNPTSTMSLPSASARVITSIYTIEKTTDGYEAASLCVKFEKSGSNTVITVADEEPYVLQTNAAGDLSVISKGEVYEASYLYNNHDLYDIHDDTVGYGITFSNSVMEELYEYYDTESGTVTGRKIYLTGGTGSQTTYVDHRYNSNDTLIVNYLFDKAGRTVCTYSNDFCFNVYSAANYEYDKAIGSSNSRNDIYSATGMLPWNLLANGSAETSGSFTNATYSTAKAKTGLRSILLADNASIPGTTVQLIKGQEYTFSAYVNLESASSISTSGGVYLKVSAASGTEQYTSYRLFTKSDSSDQWQRIYLKFTPATTGSYSLSLCRSGVSGSVYFDDLQLETGADLCDYSYVSNGAFSIQNDWLCSDSSSVAYTTASANSSTTWSCMKITGDPSKQEYFYQNIPMQNSGKSFTLSGWAKANSATLKDDRTFELRAVITYTDGTTEEVSVPFSADQKGVWQFASGRVTPSKAETVLNIKVFARYDYNCGEAYFTGISLVESDAIAISSETEDGENEEAEEVGEYPKESVSTLTAVLECLGLTQDAFAGYLNNSSITSEITLTVDHMDDSQIYTKTFANDLFYATVQQDAENDADRTWYTLTLSAYDTDGNLVCTVDTLGGVTRYSYDADGNMTAETSPLGTVTNYTYTDGQLLSAGVTGKANILYNYTGKKLTGVTAGLNDANGTQGYTFIYDAYGNLTEVKAGNYSLVAYIYDSDGINVKTVTYGNGLVIKYVYDMLDRIEKIQYNGIDRYTCAYTGNGTVLSVTDEKNCERKVYLSNGNTDCVLTIDTTYNTVKAVAYSVADDDGKTISAKEGFFTNSEWREEHYGYTYNADGELTALNAGGLTQNYSYDALKRITSVTNAYITKSYSYRTNSGKTCDLVSSLVYTKADGSSILSLNYEYDAAGNIKRVSKGDTVYYQYTYDELGQLIREDNRDANKSYTYSYDSRGNILEKNTFAFTLGEALPVTAQSTVSYSYATDSWKDRLTSYDGRIITYDSIGNPLTYNNGSTYSFTWEGRQMQTATKDSTTWTYTYNSDGLRTKKSYVTTYGSSGSYDYTWSSDGKLTSLSWTSSWGDQPASMLFYYDAEGRPAFVDYVDEYGYTTGRYEYILNLQGDVVALYCPTRKANVVTYTYDAWGKQLGFTALDSGYAGLVYNNPLRYRGYCYDEDTGFYYLQSRYYDPTVGRFLNADDATLLSVSRSVIDLNLFVYCDNNPINRLDVNGYNSMVLPDSYKYIELLCGIVSAAIEGLSLALPKIMSGILTSIASIKTALTTSWFVPLCIAATAVAIVGIVYVVKTASALYATAEQVISKVKSQIKSGGINEKTGGYSVYVITKKKSEDVVYVGMTNCVARRRSQHQSKRFPKNKYDFYVVATDLSKESARALEQTLITAYSLDTLANMINSISPKKWGTFENEFDQMMKLIESWIDPE